MALKLQLVERIDFLGHMHVIAVRDVALVGNALDNAEAALQALRELVRRGFERRAIQREVDVARFLPLGALVVHVLHNLERERRAFRIGVAVAGHVLHAFIQARVSQRNGGIASVEQLVDGLALGQARQCAVLPQNRRRVGKRALQAVVAAHKGFVAQLQALIEDFPELLLVALRGTRDIDQVDGNDALVEAAVVLRLARFVVARVGHIVVAVARAVGGKEATAAHAGVAIAVALGLALGKLQLAHLLLGNVVGHHALGGALRGQLRKVEIRSVLGDVVFLEHIDELRERRGNPDACLVLHTLVALTKHFFDNHGQVALLFGSARLVEVHEHRDERRLAVGGHERDDLVLDGLHAAADFIAQASLDHFVDFLGRGFQAQRIDFVKHLTTNLLTAYFDERRKVRKRDGLAAILAARHLSDNLGGDVACRREAMRALDECAGNHGAVLQHIFQVHKVAIVHMLREVIGVVEVDDALVMGGHNLGRQQKAHGNVFGNLARHIVALHGIHRGVLVRILLLHFFVVAFDERQDFVVGGVRRALERLEVAIDDVLARNLETTQGHNLVLDHVLDFLDRHGMASAAAQPFNAVGGKRDLIFGKALVRRGVVVGRGDRVHDLLDVERYFRAAALDDFHRIPQSIRRHVPLLSNRAFRCPICAHHRSLAPRP